MSSPSSLEPPSGERSMTKSSSSSMHALSSLSSSAFGSRSAAASTCSAACLLSVGSLSERRASHRACLRCDTASIRRSTAECAVAPIAFSSCSTPSLALNVSASRRGSVVTWITCDVPPGLGTDTLITNFIGTPRSFSDSVALFTTLPPTIHSILVAADPSKTTWDQHASDLLGFDLTASLIGAGDIPGIPTPLQPRWKMAQASLVLFPQNTPCSRPIGRRTSLQPRGSSTSWE
eukprot:3863377-Rhodomonas_salina.13